MQIRGRNKAASNKCNKAKEEEKLYQQEIVLPISLKVDVRSAGLFYSFLIKQKSCSHFGSAKEI